jgi:alkylation response protein AidB-like acyl-CoA dehydrogenase
VLDRKKQRRISLDIALTEDQRLLQDATRRFLERHSPVGAMRKLIGGEAGFDRDTWRQGAELGWLSLFAPETHGGMAEAAQGVVDAAILAEELGRVVFSGPFLPVNVVAFAVAAAGSAAQQDALLPGLVGGELIATWCFCAPGRASGVEPGGVRVTRSADGFVLDGTASYVEDAQVADHLLVTAVDGSGLSQFLVPAKAPGVTISPLEALDLGRRLADVRFERVRVGNDALLGPAGGAAAQVERQLQVALVLQSAEIVGVADRALEFTLDYVKQRVAFGRPIGSFQAIKHRLAEHAAQLEGAKAATAYAAQAVQDNAPDAAVAATIAKAQSGRCGTEIVRDCLQMHGGIGMTFDHDIHLYLRRAVSNEALWGTPAAHYERLCQLAGL